MRLPLQQQLLFVILVFVASLELIFQPIGPRPKLERITIRYPLALDVEQLLKPEPAKAPDKKDQNPDQRNKNDTKDKNKEAARKPEPPIKKGVQAIADEALKRIATAIPTVRTHEIAVSLKAATREQAAALEKQVTTALQKRFDGIVAPQGYADRLRNHPLVRLGPIAIYRPRSQIRLGLDLHGGSYVVLQLRRTLFVYRLSRSSGATPEQRDAFAGRVREMLTQAGVGDVEVDVPEKKVETVRIRTQAANNQQFEGQKKLIPEVLRRIDPGVQEAQKPISYIEELDKQQGVDPLEQSVEIIRNRVDALGVSEVEILKSEPDRIIVSLPGIRDPQEALRAIRETARLEFRLLPQKYTPQQEPGAPFVTFQDSNKTPISSGRVFDEAGPLPNEADRNDPGLGGKDLLPNAYASKNEMDEHTVNLQLKGRGRRIFGQVTTKNVNRHLAIFLDSDCISAPNIREPIPGGRVQISGGFADAKEALRLATLLNAGALPVPIDIVENRSISATLGADVVRKSLNVGIVSFALVALFMVVYYGIPGMFADLALTLYCVLILGAIVAFQASLTLPGVAGLILSIAMSVDTNVLIFERLKEELSTDKTFKAALQAAFERAWTAILDSHVTTLIAGVVLYQFGTGPVKGFAVTLCIGIIASLFTANSATRVFLSCASNSPLGGSGLRKFWLPLPSRSRRPPGKLIAAGTQ